MEREEEGGREGDCVYERSCDLVWPIYYQVMIVVHIYDTLIFIVFSTNSSYIYISYSILCSMYCT